MAISTAGEKAYRIIREAILSGRFEPSQRLKEAELTALCNVSRTPVREALHRLGTEGIVVVTPNSGAQVSTVSPTELEEIYALRAMLEAHAAARAARNLTPDAIDRLKHLAAAMEDLILQPPEVINREFTPVNAAFHKIILDAAMSPRLAAMAGLVVQVPLVLRTLASYSIEDRRRSMAHHRELIEAFIARDAEWASSVMKSHIHAAFRALVRGQTPDREEGG